MNKAITSKKKRDGARLFEFLLIGLCSGLAFGANPPERPGTPTPVELDGHYHDVDGIFFTPDGKTLITRSREERLILIRSARTGKILHRIRHRNLGPATIAPDGKTLAVAADDLYLYDIASGRLKTRKRFLIKNYPLPVFAARIFEFDVLNADRLLLGLQGDLYSFSLRDEQLKEVYYGLRAGGYRGRFCQREDGAFLVLKAPREKNVELWRRGALKPEHVFEFANPVHGLHCARNGFWTTAGGQLVSVDFKSKKKTERPINLPEHFRGIDRIGGNERNLVVRVFFGRVLFLLREREKTALQVPGGFHSGEITAFTISPDDQSLLVAHARGKILRYSTNPATWPANGDGESFPLKLETSILENARTYRRSVDLDENCTCQQGDCKNGTGTCSFRSSAMRYEGNFKDGLRHGAGRLHLPLNQQWNGNWAADALNGPATFHHRDYKSHTVLHGRWHLHKLHGPFRISRDGKEIARGEYRSGQPLHGFGVGPYRGFYYSGQWRDGRPHGAGVLFTGKDGAIMRRGKWENGEPAE